MSPRDAGRGTWSDIQRDQISCTGASATLTQQGSCWNWILRGSTQMGPEHGTEPDYYLVKQRIFVSNFLRDNSSVTLYMCPFTHSFSGCSWRKFSPCTHHSIRVSSWSSQCSLENLEGGGELAVFVHILAYHFLPFLCPQFLLFLWGQGEVSVVLGFFSWSNN